ncbi:hypothetical protein B7P43_G16757 [Cryptotermes secundus]|uniref:DDE-1 domain-containing protein n=1 Tax=Cryptotermes secundus TaxID=105785 RepID=A0A2J7RKG6_9NEOP|nr:hypothetical protein B7P43_G16757 [Cryptotermes secundus]
MNLPLHVLLVMINTPAHPPDLQDDLLEEFKFIKIQFLPPNTTPLLQPMDQQVISNFKKLYTISLFERCFEGFEIVPVEPVVNKIASLAKIMGLEVDNNDIDELVKKHSQELTTDELMELHCVSQQEVVEESLSEEEEEEEVGFEIVPVEPVVNKIVSLAKIMGLEVDNNDIDELVKKHSQELTTDELMELHCVSQQEVVEESLSEEEEEEEVGFEIVPVEPVVNKIASLAKIMGLEVDNNDIDELVKKHSQELTTDELMELHCVSQQEVVEESLSEEEEEEEVVTAKQQSSGAIREILKVLETVAQYIEKHHPNKAVAMRATNLFNGNAVSHFHQILKRQQKQISLDSFLVKKN